jgi:hypothetical protein
MQNDYIATIIEAENTRKEMMETYNSWMVNTNSVYNKHALKRARTLARKYTELNKKFAKLSTIISSLTARELLDIRETVQQKTTS